MSLDLRRRYATQLKHIYGLSGDSAEELVWWYSRALGFADTKTLAYYVGHRGFELTAAQVEKYGGAKDLAKLAVDIKRRPFDSRKVGASGGPRRHAPRPKLRWSDGFGIEIHGDKVGPYAGTGKSAVVWCDPGHHPPFVEVIAVAEGMKDKLVPYATKEIVELYRRYGHHYDEWGEAIAAIRTDYGSDFASEETAKICKGFRIAQRFSTPHAHEQNGLAENVIGQIFRLISAFYAAAAWAPPALWMYCLEYAVRCYNLRIGDDGVPAYESFYDQEVDFRKQPHLPWGCVVLVFVPKKLRSWKFAEHSVPAMFIGVPKGTKEAIMVYVPLTKRVRVVREYVIVDQVPKDWPRYNGMVFPAGSLPQPDAMLPLNAAEVLFEDDFAALAESLGTSAAEPCTSRNAVVEEVDTGGKARVSGKVDNSSSTTAAVQEVNVTAAGKVGGAEVRLVPTVQLTNGVELDTDQSDDESSEVSDASSAPECAPAGAAAAAVEEVNMSQLTTDATVTTSASAGADCAAAAASTDASQDLDEGDAEVLLPKIPTLNYILLEHGSTRRMARVRLRPISPFQRARADRDVELSYQEKVRVRRIQLEEKRKAKRTKGYKRRSSDKPSMYTALRGPYRQHVEDAIKAELEQYTETFEAVRILSATERDDLSLVEMKNALTSHFEIEYKRDQLTGEIIRVKARLVIHGNQVHKYDFDEIKSPTVRPAAVKLILSMLAKVGPGGKRFKERGWDIKGAFLQNNIFRRSESKRGRDPSYRDPDDILLRLPDGRLALMKSYCYGLKQASYEWYQRMHEVLTSNGFVATNDPCVYHWWEGEDLLVMSVHVDDVFAIATEDWMLDALDIALAKEFETETCKMTRHIGPRLSYLKMSIHHRDDGSVTVDQSLYISRLINDWGYGRGESANNEILIDEEDPGDVTHPLQSSYTTRRGDSDPIDSTWYRGVVGAINYAATMTRPDLLYAMSILAAHAANPTRLQRRMLKRVMKYLVATKDWKMTFNHDDDWELVAWADASYASREEARSQSGYCFALGANNASFYAKSQKQKLVTLSSTEAEYVALFHAVTELVYLRRLLEELGFRQRATLVFQDNQSTILWAEGQMNHQRTKHISVKYHYIQMLVQEGQIELEHIPTGEMRADLQTKALTNELFQYMAGMHLGFV